jgi:hypothetical protein
VIDLDGHSEKSAQRVATMATAARIENVDDDSWDTCPGPRCYGQLDERGRLAPDHGHVDREWYREQLRAAKAEIEWVRGGGEPRW